MQNRCNHINIIIVNDTQDFYCGLVRTYSTSSHPENEGISKSQTESIQVELT